MAAVYGLAIVLTFTGLGVLMAVLVGAAGAQSFASNPWVNLFIGVIFIIFAFSLLGLFELRLPSGLVNYFNRKSTESRGYSGVLFMGLTLTVVSFSCTAPFIGGLLAATTPPSSAIIPWVPGDASPSPATATRARSRSNVIVRMAKEGLV